MPSENPKADKLKVRYGASEHGNFAVVDTMGVPHPYCVGSKHVAYASDFGGGILNERTIEAAERIGAKCCTRGCTLRYRDHEHALVVHCKASLMQDGVAHPELHAYLLKVKPLCVEDKYVGFAFVDGTKPDA